MERMEERGVPQVQQGRGGQGEDQGKGGKVRRKQSASLKQMFNFNNRSRAKEAREKAEGGGVAVVEEDGKKFTIRES